jgi:hypothetical protein
MANTFKFGNGEWAVGKETALAYNDENSNFKPLPFTFDRASTATVVNKDGLIETVGVDEPRIDFLNNTNGHLLLEPQRKNLVTYSEDFSNSSWNKQTFGTGVEASVITTTELAPDGSTNAFLVTLNSGSGTTPSDQAKITKSIVNLSSGLDYTESIYLKGVNGGEQVLLGVSNIGTIKVTLTTEWKRFILSGTSGGGFNSVGPLIRRGLQEPLNSYAQFYMWGSQFEEGSYATSYIPTSGQSGGVTRSAEICSQTVPDGVIGQTEGTVYVDFLSVNNFDGSSGNLFQIKEDNNNRINIYFSNGTPRLFGIENSIGVFNQALSLTTGSVCRLAIKYNSNSTKVFMNGSLSHTLNGINNIAFNDYSFSTNNNINYNEIKLYNTALSDSELQALTT